MIERARANAEASGVDHETPCPAFVVGDVAAPLHRHVSDPAEHARGLPLRLAA